MAAVTVKQVGSTPNTIDVTINGETHTAASAIVERLNGDASCEYAAYKVAHPKDEFVTIRIKGDAHRSAKDVLRSCLAGLVRDIDDLIAHVRR